MEFRCIQDCSQCCIEREYYPEKKFGKIGVLIIPEEKEKIEKLAKIKGLDILILPRIGISKTKDSESIECSDGTVWQKGSFSHDEWYQCQDIPEE